MNGSMFLLDEERGEFGIGELAQASEELSGVSVIRFTQTHDTSGLA